MESVKRVKKFQAIVDIKIMKHLKILVWFDSPQIKWQNSFAVVLAYGQLG